MYWLYDLGLADMLPTYKIRRGEWIVASKKKKESGSGGLGEMVRRGAQKLARDPRAQRTAKKGVSRLVQRLRGR